MLTYNELIELKTNLINGEIGLDQAKKQCWTDFKEGQRSWHSKDWKERRSEFIGDKCEICSSRDTLTLQHLFHPRKFSEFLTEVTREYTNDYINNNPEIDIIDFRTQILKNYDYLPIPLCPNCMSRNPNKRLRKVPQFLCIECRHEFDEVVYKSVDELISTFYENDDAIEVRDKCFVSRDKWHNHHNLSDIRYWQKRQLAKNKDSDAIEKKAFLLYLDDSIKYLSFEDTITCCKKCAANYDLYNLELCPNCKKYYKGVQFKSCIQCLPEDNRKIALEKVEFGKQWRDMEKNLGIE